MLKKVLRVILFLVIVFSSGVTTQGITEAQDGEMKPRVIVTTDGEEDDIASMHRFLLYANDFDIEGIISSASRWHWAGDPDANPPIAESRWHGTEWIPELIDNGYREAYANLVQHDPSYPTPEYLLSIVRDGNITLAGEMAKDTEGSNLIKDILLDDEPGLVFLQAWGGTNTIAAALRSIHDEYVGTPEWDAIYRKVSDKAVIYIIQDQDLVYKEYISEVWPEVSVIINRDQFEAFAYRWTAYNPEPLIDYFRADWTSENILKGPLMASYPINEEGDWFSEGDSPSFLHVIPTGLDQLENPSYGGWGGRFVQVGPRLWVDDPRYLGIDQDRASDSSPYVITETTLAVPAEAGSTNVNLASTMNADTSPIHPVSEFLNGDQITIGSGDAAEIRTIVNAGTGAVSSTLTEAAPVGSTNVKYAFASSGWVTNSALPNFVPGAELSIGSGETQETVTITDVGSPKVETMLVAPAPAGATNIKVQSTGAWCSERVGCFTEPLLQRGDVITIGTETDSVSATVLYVGTPSASGTGLILEEPLPNGFDAETPVLTSGSGLTFKPAITSAHPIDEALFSPGTGMTLDTPLDSPFPAGTVVAHHNSPHWPQARWAAAIQNDLAARVDWTIAPDYADANHPPIVNIPRWRQVISANPGERVRLTSAAYDPDGDGITYSWWQYAEAGTYPGTVQMMDENGHSPWFVVPEDANTGDTIHIILEVSDDGTPPMTRYQRAIIIVN